METDKKVLPILLKQYKQYIRLGVKLLGFNIDRFFTDGLDGLIMVDLKKCDCKLLECYMGRTAWNPS